MRNEDRVLFASLIVWLAGYMGVDWLLRKLSQRRVKVWREGFEDGRDHERLFPTATEQQEPEA